MVVVIQVPCEKSRVADRAVFERDFGFADRSPGLRSGPETKNRNHTDATRRRPLAPEKLGYVLFFASYLCSGTNRLFPLLHYGCHVDYGSSVSVE